jgi:hypothetical protein
MGAFCNLQHSISTVQIHNYAICNCEYKYEDVVIMWFRSRVLVSNFRADIFQNGTLSMI